MTISEIEQKLLNGGEQDETFVGKLKCDERKGVQRILKKWEKRKENERKLHNKFVEMTMFERKYRARGYRLIAGIDEAGRGPLAGPVVAAAVILPEDFCLLGIDDSKKLNEEKRENYFEKIKSEAVAVSVGMVEAREIDRMNILEASKKAMLEAVLNLTVKPDFLLIDAVDLTTPYHSEPLIKGDARSISIAAASIIAKVTRDRLMKEVSKEYPQYGLASNMGYGTAEHLEAIKNYGVTPHHRKTFAPIKNLIEGR